MANFQQQQQQQQEQQQQQTAATPSFQPSEADKWRSANQAMLSPYSTLDLDPSLPSTEPPRVIYVLANILDTLVAQNEAELASSSQAGSSTGSSGSHGKLTVFHGLRAPTISIEKYLERIYKYSNCSPSCLVASFVYMDRLLTASEGLVINSLNVHRLLITSVMTAAKFLDDTYYNNAYYAKVGGVTTAEMNRLELELLFRLEFRLQLTPEEFYSHCAVLQRHQQFLLLRELEAQRQEEREQEAREQAEQIERERAEREQAEREFVGREQVRTLDLSRLVAQGYASAGLLQDYDTAQPGVHSEILGYEPQPPQHSLHHHPQQQEHLATEQSRSDPRFAPQQEYLDSSSQQFQPNGPGFQPFVMSGSNLSTTRGASTADQLFCPNQAFSSFQPPTPTGTLSFSGFAAAQLAASNGHASISDDQQDMVISYPHMTGDGQHVEKYPSLVEGQVCAENLSFEQNIGACPKAGGNDVVMVCERTAESEADNALAVKKSLHQNIPQNIPENIPLPMSQGFYFKFGSTRQVCPGEAVVVLREEFSVKTPTRAAEGYPRPRTAC